MYKVKVNDDKEREIIFTGNEFSINGKKGSWDLIKLPHGRFHILKEHRSYTAEVISADYEKKTFSLKVNNTVYSVQVKDRFDELLKKLGMESYGANTINNIIAPMPGLVLKILIAEKQEIKEGDSLIVLEAMKMENVIKSPGTGTVKLIKVKERDAVEKNQILIEIG